FGVMHERTLSWDRANAVLSIEDSLDGEPIEATARVLFAPECQVCATNATATVGWSGGTISITTDGATVCATEVRDHSPAFGRMNADHGLQFPFETRLETQLHFTVEEH